MRSRPRRIRAWLVVPAILVAGTALAWSALDGPSAPVGDVVQPVVQASRPAGPVLPALSQPAFFRVVAGAAGADLHALPNKESAVVFRRQDGDFVVNRAEDIAGSDGIWRRVAVGDTEAWIAASQLAPFYPYPGAQPHYYSASVGYRPDYYALTPGPYADPASAVRTFYSHLGRKELTAAWDALGPAFKARVSYDEWAKGFATTLRVEAATEQVAMQAPDRATVWVRVSADDMVNGQRTTSTFNGSWGLVRVGGSWKLDTPQIEKST